MDELNGYSLPLPLEVIMNIFENCDTETLGRLARTCRAFRQIINTDYLWRERCKNVLGSNCAANEILKRSKPLLSDRSKCRVSKRWVKHQCELRVLFKYRRLMTLNVELEEGALFCSNGRRIERYDRDVDGSIIPHLAASRIAHGCDISKFVINGEDIITAGRDGTIETWNKRTFKRIDSCEISGTKAARDINCIDAKQDVIVSGSRNASIRVWRTKARSNPEVEILTGVKVLSLSIMPSNRTLVVGLPGTCDIHPLQLYDLETYHYICNLGKHVHGAGILDLYPEDDHTLLSCGYDTYIRLWDIRTPQQCVSSWMEPYDNSIYCVRSDHNVTILSGANRNSMLHLWDKRCTEPVNVNCVRGYDSPVYSIAFDASHQIVALDSAVFQYTFDI